MLCNYYDVALDAGDEAFSIDASNVTFGPGCLREAGDVARTLGINRIAVFTDDVLAKTEHVSVVLDSLRAAGVDIALYDSVRVEPTDVSLNRRCKIASSRSRMTASGQNRVPAATIDSEFSGNATCGPFMTNVA